VLLISLYNIVVLFLQAFENLKKRAKKAAAADKLEKLKTGGGTYVVQVGQTDEKLLSMLGNKAEPLTNIFDSDADYYATTGLLSLYTLHTDEFSVKVALR